MDKYRLAARVVRKQEEHQRSECEGRGSYTVDSGTGPGRGGGGRADRSLATTDWKGGDDEVEEALSGARRDGDRGRGEKFFTL